MNECLLAAPAEVPAPPDSLELDSNLGPASAEPLRLALLGIMSAMEAAHSTDAVRLDAAAVDQVGTGALQVLLAAAAQFEAQGRRLILERPSPRLCEWARLAGVPWLVSQQDSSGAEEREGSEN
jgi:anti-anti-sigma regulatory factor